MSDDRIKSIVEALHDVVETSVIWPRGLVNRGGPHRRIRGKATPISIGEDECEVFGKLIDTFKPKDCFIVGDGFGFSSAYIGKAMMENGGQSVITLDAQVEGGEYCAEISQQLTDRLELSIVEHKKGFSPQDVPASVESDAYEMIFIDGKHSHPQVTHDFDGVLPYSDDKTIFVWHDFWIRGIPESVDVARREGVRCLWIPTSCEMVVGTKDDALFEQIYELFPRGDEHRVGRSLLRFLSIVAYEYVFRFAGVWRDRLIGGRKVDKQGVST